MKKFLIALILCTTLLLSLVPVAAAEVLSVAPGGSCTVNGKTYLTDRYTRAVYTVKNGELKLLTGQTDVLDRDGRPVSGYTDGDFDEASFGEPWGIAPYRDGLLIADRENNVLRYADLKKERVYTLAGSGKAGERDGKGEKARFDSPTDLAVGENGILYVADTGNDAIRCIDEKGNVTTYWDDLSSPMGLCFADGTLYIAETGNHRILSIRDGSCSLTAGATLSGDAAIEGDFLNGSAENARFSSPSDVVVRDGVLYIADTGNDAVRVIRDGYVLTLDVPDETVSPDGFFTLDGTVCLADGFLRTAQILPEPEAEAVYTDLTGSPYEAAIRFVTANGIMNGTGEGRFSPDAPVTRGMILTILARLDGMDTSVGEVWYDIGVQWGMDSGVSDGTNPGASITREQLVTMLYRYAGEPAADAGSAPADVSEYARSAAAWAISAELLPDEFLPQGYPSRGEIAAILELFLRMS